MKKVNIIVVWISVILIAIGLGLGVFALFTVNFNFSALSTDNREKCSVSFNDWYDDIVGEGEHTNIDSLDLNSISDDIKILKTDKDEPYVEYYDGDKFGYEFFVSGSSIKAVQTDKRPWYEHFFNFSISSEDRSFVIYLPDYKYLERMSELKMNSVSGDIKIEGDASNFLEYDINTVSGNIDISFGHVLQNLTINTVSGEVKLDRCNTYSFKAKTVSGDMTFKDTVVVDSSELDTVSGDIILERYDCSLTNANSISGDIKGTVLEEIYGKFGTTSGETEFPSYSHSDEDETDKKEEKERDDDFIYPQGEREFNAETVSGDVLLRLAD